MTDLRPLHVTSAIAALAADIRSMAGEDDDAFIGTLDGESDVIDAARAAVRMILASEAQEEALKALVERYQARAKGFADRASRARETLSTFMQDIGEKSLPLPEATLTLANGQPSLVGEADPASLSDDLVKVERKADRTKIKAAIQAGQVVEVYSLSNAKPRLQIRVK